MSAACSSGQQLTLARKFDTVHRKTVTSSKQMPNVRLATPPRPMLAQNPDCLVGIGGGTNSEAVDAIISTASSLSPGQESLR